MDQGIRDQIINGCQGIRECELALFNPSPTSEGVISQVRNAIHTREHQKSRKPSQFTLDSSDEFQEQGDANYTERKYGIGHENPKYIRKFRNLRSRQGDFTGTRFPQPNSERRQKKCYVCRKSGCWSTRHTDKERKEAFTKF